MDTRSLLEQLNDEQGSDDEPWVLTADRDLNNAATALHEATEALIVQRQRTKLRRFETLNSASIMDGGLGAVRELAGARASMNSEQRLLELQAELTASRQQAQAQARRAARIWCR